MSDAWCVTQGVSREPLAVSRVCLNGGVTASMVAGSDPHHPPPARIGTLPPPPMPTLYSTHTPTSPFTMRTFASLSPRKPTPYKSKIDPTGGIYIFEITHLQRWRLCRHGSTPWKYLLSGG